MDEELTTGPQPARDPAPELAVVAHVLEHLDADDAVEPLRPDDVRVRPDAEVPDVAGQHGHVAEPSLGRLSEDVLALRRGVRDRDDPCSWEALSHEQRERPPAAAELEDVLTVGDAGSPTGELEHGLLSLREGRHTLRPPSGGVLQVRAEDQAEEVCRHLVVLRVRGIHRHGHGPGEERLSELLRTGRRRAAPCAEQRPDRRPEHRIGQPSRVDEPVEGSVGTPHAPVMSHGHEAIAGCGPNVWSSSVNGACGPEYGHVPSVPLLVLVRTSWRSLR